MKVTKMVDLSDKEVASACVKVLAKLLEDGKAAMRQDNGKSEARREDGEYRAFDDADTALLYAISVDQEPDHSMLEIADLFACNLDEPDGILLDTVSQYYPDAVAVCKDGDTFVVWRTNEDGK